MRHKVCHGDSIPLDRAAFSHLDATHDRPAVVSEFLLTDLYLAQGTWRQSRAVWLAAAAVGHDVVLFPPYALGDRILAARADRPGGPGRPGRRPEVRLRNYIRLPAIAADLTLLTLLPGIIEQGAPTCLAATGQTQQPFLGRWLLLTAVMFAISAVACGARLIGVRGRNTAHSAAPRSPGTRCCAGDSGRRVTTLSTPAAAPVIAEARPRGGKTGSARGAARELKQAITTARAIDPTAILLARGDAASGKKKVIGVVPDEQVEFSLTVSRNRRVTNAIEVIDAEACTPAAQTGRGRRPTGALISDAEVAETPKTVIVRARAAAPPAVTARHTPCRSPRRVPSWCPLALDIFGPGTSDRVRRPFGGELMRAICLPGSARCLPRLREMPMDLFGASHEGGGLSVAARWPNGARDRRAGSPRDAAVRSDSLRAVQRAPTSPRNTEMPVEDASAPVRDTADQLQADYFVRLLTQNRCLVDQRIDKYRKAIAAAEAKGDVEGARAFRGMTLGEEHDRQNLDGMIEELRRRFPRRAPGDVVPIARRMPVAGR